MKEQSYLKCELSFCARVLLGNIRRFFYLKNPGYWNAYLYNIIWCFWRYCLQVRVANRTQSQCYVVKLESKMMSAILLLEAMGVYRMTALSSLRSSLSACSIAESIILLFCDH